MMNFSIIEAQENIGKPCEFEFITTAKQLDIVSGDFRILENIMVTGIVVFTGNVFKVEGEIALKKFFQCDRCLENFTQEKKYNFSEQYKKQEQELENGFSNDLIYFSGDYIEISDLIRETILLSQPLNNICSSDCRGLCIKCGANLNKVDCGCDRQIIDPRLEALQKLLNNKK